MSELILYQTEEGKAEVRLRAKNILEEGELMKGATVKESLTTAAGSKNAAHGKITRTVCQ